MSGKDWTALCATAEVLPGETHVALVVVNYDGAFYALEDRCTHDEFELSAGPFDPATGQIECVLHGARFDVRSGEAMCPPAYEPVRTYPLKVEGGVVYVQEAE